MPYFDDDEIQFISFYTGADLKETLENIRAMSEFISENETMLEQMTASVLFKLSQMEEAQFQELIERIIPDTLMNLPIPPEMEA